MPPVTKFVAPTVANGKVYVPSISNVITIYGLFSPSSASGATPAISTVANAASYSQDAVAPGEMVAIFGSSLGPLVPAGLQLDDSGNVATTLAGTQVLFDGVAAPHGFRELTAKSTPSCLSACPAAPPKCRCNTRD